MNTTGPTELNRSSTDFGRQMSAETDVSLAAALRDHAARMAKAEALRYQLAMGLLGFIGGLMLVVPLVLWAAPRSGSIFPGATAAAPPAISPQFIAADTASNPTLVSVPTIAARDEPREPKANEVSVASAQAGSGNADAVELARRLIRSGDILAARRVLEQPDLGQSGQALFMLAETYDPNVLAALGATDILAEAPIARQYYEAALAEGVSAASHRIEALE